MSFCEETTLKNGNARKVNPKVGGCPNRSQLALQRIGEENAKQILEMHIQAALSGEKEAQQFILSRFMPAAKAGRLIEIDLPTLENTENIKTAFGLIVKNVSNGTISPEEGEKMCNMVEHQRKAIETNELDKRLRILEENAIKMER